MREELLQGLDRLLASYGSPLYFNESHAEAFHLCMVNLSAVIGRRHLLDLIALQSRKLGGLPSLHLTHRILSRSLSLCRRQLGSLGSPLGSSCLIDAITAEVIKRQTLQDVVVFHNLGDDVLQLLDQQINSRLQIVSPVTHRWGFAPAIALQD